MDKMYINTLGLPCIHKGHLVPGETYSFSHLKVKYTFVYTNAVPQFEKFNSGAWSNYESRIRDYGKQNCSSTYNGDLYLLTGTSGIRIVSVFRDKIQYRKPTIEPLRMPLEPKIVIPRSMWSAGCCMSGGTVHGAFAVIGNNEYIFDMIHMSKVTVKSLTKIIGAINLFPGNDACNDKQIMKIFGFLIHSSAEQRNW